MTKQFLQEYVEASPSERMLKEALVDKTEAEILRAYELQCFYDVVEKNLYRMKEVGLSSDGSSSAQRMHITYAINSFEPMMTTSTPGSFPRPILMHREQEQHIDLSLAEYYKNQRLLEIFIRWLSLANYATNENIAKVILNTPAIVMLGFTQEEIERTYEKTQRA